MATNRRRSQPLSGLNFRPNLVGQTVNSASSTAANLGASGVAKPITSEPASIREIFTLGLLYICKKSLFFNTNIKIGIYLAIVFLLSLVADVATVPKWYLSRRDNILNWYFVKWAWAWNLVLLVPFVLATSYIYCCGQKFRVFSFHMARLLCATAFWYCFTYGFNVIESLAGHCSQKLLPTRGQCLKSGAMWNGFDISGHTFILIYGSLLLIEEGRCVINWERIKDYLRSEQHFREKNAVGGTNSSGQINPLRTLSNEDFQLLRWNYTTFTPYIRVLFVGMTLLQILWDCMLVTTILYHHIMIEKFMGAVVAIFTWYFTYRVWYAHPKCLPKLPGDGVFKYMKSGGVENANFSTSSGWAASRRRTFTSISSNISSNNGQLGPKFMGRYIYQTQLQDNTNEDIR